MKMIALMGKSRSGKDTAGKLMASSFPDDIVTTAFADKLKRMCMELYGLTEEDVYTEEGKERASRFVSWKCPACNHLDCFRELSGREYRVVCKTCTAVGSEESFKSHWKNREILQHIGTEGCRRVDDKVWVNFVLRAAAAAASKITIVTDCRFKSEADSVWAAGGEVWRIRRPETDRVQAGLARHASEMEMDTIPDSMFQQVITNDHTLEAFESRVKVALDAFLGRQA